MAALATAVALTLAGQASAEEHIFSYEPASAPTRALTQTGLSFEFEKHGFASIRVLRIVQTGERGSAGLKPASEGELGQGGLKAALGGEAPVGGLYQIAPTGDGQAFVGAVCPGAERAWLVIGPMRRFRDLSVQAIGRDPGAPASHRCVDLAFSFYNEWTLPPDRTPPHPRFDRNLP